MTERSSTGTAEVLAKRLECSENSILRLSGRSMPMKLNAVERDMIVAALRSPAQGSLPCGEIVAWRWRSIFNADCWSYATERPAEHPQFITEPLYGGAQTPISSRESPAPDPCESLTIGELIEWLDSPQYTNGFLDFEAANHMSAAAELLDKLFPEAPALASTPSGTEPSAPAASEPSHGG